MPIQTVQSVCTHAGYTASRPVASSTSSNGPYTEDYLERFTIEETLWWCVFDGHGGDAVAAMCARIVERLARECYAERSTITDALVLLFSRLDATITRSVRTTSGSTCNVTVIDSRTGVMTVASLGDSRTLVYEPTSGANAPYAVVFETIDQDCADTQEKTRLRELGFGVFEQKVRVAGSPVLHSTGVYRCTTAAGRDMMTMSSFGDSVHDDPPGAINKIPRLYTFPLSESHVVVICSDGCMEHIAPYSASAIKTSAGMRVAEIAGHIQSRICAACGRMFAVGAAMLAEHITTSQINSMARLRGDMLNAQAGRAIEPACASEAEHRQWVQREFDNQTVVAVYIGATCTCSH
jgi:serine/threonine protein phosphatase PrpC